MALTGGWEDSKAVQRHRESYNKEGHPMQDFFIGFAFILMVLSPCLVAIISGPTDETINS